MTQDARLSVDNEGYQEMTEARGKEQSVGAEQWATGKGEEGKAESPVAGESIGLE